MLLWRKPVVHLHTTAETTGANMDTFAMRKNTGKRLSAAAKLKFLIFATSSSLGFLALATVLTFILSLLRRLISFIILGRNLSSFASTCLLVIVFLSFLVMLIASKEMSAHMHTILLNRPLHLLSSSRISLLKVRMQCSTKYKSGWMRLSVL